MKIGFYSLGKKGFFALNEFIKIFGGDSIAFVIGAQDNNIENDWHSDLAEFCLKNGIFFITRGESKKGRLPDADFKFAIGWRWLIKESSNLIVFHDSILPKYRGFSPLVNMLIDGVDEVGVTALLASEEYDKGEIIYQSKKCVTYPIKILDAIDEIIPLYAELVINTAKDIFHSGFVKSFPQDENLASYSLWRDENDYFIDWNFGASRVKRFVDAVGLPFKGAASFFNGKIVRILDGESVQDVIIENRNECIGKIIFFHDLYPVVVCSEGLFMIKDIRSEDGTTLIGKIQFRSRFLKQISL